MPEYRRDLLTGRMVIVAEERATRPYQFDIEQGNPGRSGSVYRNDCPFCSGNESLTPNEIEAFRSDHSPPDSPGWTVRTIPNKYPAVAENPETDWADLSFQKTGPLSESMDGIGAHEVIVDTPRHILSIADMTDGEVDAMFRMYRNRLQSFRDGGRFASVLIFKNVGAAAGASLPHSHSQLVAMPFVPASQRLELERSNAYREKSAQKCCVWCDMLAAELRDDRRIVEETEHCVVLCPYVSRFPAEVAVYPKIHEPFFEKLSDEIVSDLSITVRRTVRKLEKATPWMKGRLAYNMILHAAPFRSEMSASFHGHLSILPSLSRAAGFEWGTGLHINPISPENAAARLRATDE